VHFTAIALLVTVRFRADVDAQPGGYATGVLALVSGFHEVAPITREILRQVQPDPIDEPSCTSPDDRPACPSQAQIPRLLLPCRPVADDATPGPPSVLRDSGSLE
jgi:hypothetical protein